MSTRATASAYMEWAKLHSAAKYNLATSGILSYPLSELPVSIGQLEINGPTVYGYAPLQERLAAKSGVTPDCVVAATGTTMANHLAMAALLTAGDDVLIERPTYGPILDVASWLNANILRFDRRPKSNFQIDPEEIQQKITPKTRLVILTNLHNPTGAYTSEGTLIRIGEIAASVGASVMVDEVYLPMVYDLPVRSSFHLADNFLVTTSLTKSYGLSGIRCGWILAQPALAKRIWRMNDLFGATPVHPGELLSVIALDNLGTVAARARHLLDQNRSAFNAIFAVQTNLSGFIPDWGTVVFPALKQGSVDDFCNFLRLKYETSVVPGHFFEMSDHFRVGLGGNPDNTAEALERLSAALDAYQVQVV